METFSTYLTAVADFVCGYPLFFILIGGGLYLFISSGAVSIRRLPHAMRQLRERPAADGGGSAGQISSLQALCSVVAATIGMGNIAGVAIALVVGGPGAIFWMWVSALVGMCTKYHEGVLAIAYRRTLPDGSTRGGSMYIIENALGPRWRWLAVTFAVAGMFGTLCIMNANQLAEATVTITAPAVAGTWFSSAASAASLSDAAFIRLLVGITLAFVTALVVLGGIRRIARVASVMVPFMVGVYFIAVLYILIDRYDRIPAAIQSIFTEAFNLRAGFGALIGTALIGARRAALVNDAGVGTATIMHSESRGTSPVREGLVAMLGPGIDSGFVCTLTALAILVAGDFTNVDGVKGLEVAMHAFGNAIPGGEYILMLIVVCFGLSSLFSYSFYGNRCATYLFGERRARLHTWFFILTLILFAVVPLQAAVGLCDLLYAFMAIPTMFTVILLSRKVRALTRAHFSQ